MASTEQTLIENMTSAWNISYDTSTSGYYKSLISSADVIEKYYIWVIFMIGFPGNIASLVTIIRMKPVTSLTCYVALLAVVDNLTLVVKLLHLVLQDYHITTITSSECKVLSFLGNVLVNYASWILVAMAIERFVAVWYPLKLGVKWTTKRSLVAMTTLFLVIVGIHLHLLWTMTSFEGKCEVAHAYYNFFMVEMWYWISATMYAFLPCTLLVLSNVLIILGIRKSADEHKSLAVLPLTSTHRDVTIMLIVVSLVFLILTTPICVFLLVGQTWLPRIYSDDFARKKLFQQIAYILCDSNHAVNFFLYFMSARRFRRQIFRCGSSSSDVALSKNRTYRYINRFDTTRTQVYYDIDSSTQIRLYTTSSN
ncbi:hypothetical protein SNE40_012607 [Patella caerulea]|uniref:G-protein coupled receptors family 1 profile domain-containing protein n=1 Tax=Patella caerulea TaxID=87958 RepID=A0AAN8JQ84_PATCE